MQRAAFKVLERVFTRGTKRNRNNNVKSPQSQSFLCTVIISTKLYSVNKLHDVTKCQRPRMEKQWIDIIRKLTKKNVQKGSYNKFSSLDDGNISVYSDFQIHNFIIIHLLCFEPWPVSHLKLLLCIKNAFDFDTQTY